MAKDATVSGADALNLNWPREELSAVGLANWKFGIPDVVNAALPSDIVAKYIRNINALDQWEALAALLNATNIIALVRDLLAGSEVGSAILNEFPLIFVYPTAGTPELTTNNGKTTLCRVLGCALVPGLSVTLVNKASGAPAQRAMAAPLTLFGTAIYDEFVLPTSAEHFLSLAGLQALATGGTVSPGRVMENGPGVSLQYPLFINSKVAVETPDIRNRQLPIFMDPHTDATKCSDAEFAKNHFRQSVVRTAAGDAALGRSDWAH